MNKGKNNGLGQMRLFDTFNSTLKPVTFVRLPTSTMGRGRPRLYNTPEERALANRSKSKRSYYK